MGYPRVSNEVKNKIIELRKTGIGYGTIAKQLNCSYNTARSTCIKNVHDWYPEWKKTQEGKGVTIVETLENGNVIRPSTKGLVPASQLRAKLCQAYFYLDRDKAKAKEAITYCLTLVDQAEQ